MNAYGMLKARFVAGCPKQHILQHSMCSGLSPAWTTMRKQTSEDVLQGPVAFLKPEINFICHLSCVPPAQILEWAEIVLEA